MKGGGLAPCEVKRPPRGVRGHAPPENFGIIHSNFLQSASKIDTRFAWQHVLHMHVYEISLMGIYN